MRSEGPGLKLLVFLIGISLVVWSKTRVKILPNLEENNIMVQQTNFSVVDCNMLR